MYIFSTFVEMSWNSYAVQQFSRRSRK